MRRFSLLRMAVKFLRSNGDDHAKFVLLDVILATMGPNAFANAVHGALRINNDPRYWRFL